jgi:diguanylate cyclase (GGDEF)-like protein/PAS domain S-box-containing protein
VVSKRLHQSVLIPADLEDWVANRLVSAHFRAVSGLILGHILNAITVVIAFFGQVPTIALVPWFLAVIATCGLRMRMTYREKNKPGKRNPQSIIQAFEINTVALAALSGGAIIWLFHAPHTNDFHSVLLAIMGATLISAAGFTMRTLPRAAIAYIAIVSACMIFTLTLTGSLVALGAAVLVGASATLMTRTANTAYTLFVVRILREREVNATAETVRMLLNDFEDHGSDWLFEVDRDHKLMSVSARFSDAVGSAPEQLNGQSFLDLFIDSEELQQLAGFLASRAAFRGHIVPVKGGRTGESLFWSISGRPASGGPSGAINFRGVISDISAEKQAEARVRHMAHYDSLTELPNRMMFTQSLHKMLADRRKKARLAVLLVDFDHFKAINDMYGHPVGDAFLKRAAERLADCVATASVGGEGRLVARLGGDEFAVLTGGEDAIDHASRLAQLIVDTMAAPFEVNGHIIDSGVSIGIALAPDHADSANILLSNADIALYAAKDDGRGRWEMFMPGMDAAVHKRLSMARDLRTAVSGGELRLFLQPLVNVESGKHSGFEALLRWQHPEHGMVMPNDFIPVAEETGLIVPMGEWVIRTALAEAASWDEPFSIAINLSPIQLRSPNLLPTIVNALGETGIDPNRVEFEITESVLLHDSEANIQVLNRMHQLGLKIALDDFGTGYASLNYLLTFPFDKIKIDRSFVTDLENRQDAQAIVGAVIRLANQLGMCTLAEGVEEEAQLQQLRAHGCEMVQGWLFGKAMPAEHYGTVKRIMSLPKPDLEKTKPRRKSA